MIDADIQHRFQEALGTAVRFDEPLSRHTSFRIGGPADVWVEAADAEQIRRAQVLAAAAGLPMFVLGGGTNVLVSDQGVRAVVLKLGRPFGRIEWHANGSGTTVRAGAAGSFGKLVAEAVRRHLAGLEFGEGIPGTVGGGLLMNAGAFGGEMASVVTTIEGVTRAGEATVFARDAVGFGYRHFDLPAGFVVTHVNFRLQRGDQAALRERVATAKERRLAGQPRGLANAGSIFKNPPGQYAGRLLETAGLKGRRIGDAMISERHANFIVNRGAATAADVRALMDEAIERVQTVHGVRLEPEVKLVGEWR